MSDSLVIENATKRFGDFVAVDDLSLRVPEGSIYGFLGPNGAGKTTTIRMIMSIFFPDQGRITVLGNPNSELVKDRLGYLPEEKGLYKKMRAAEIIGYFGQLKGLSRSDSNQRARSLLEKYGLGEWVDAKCESLSKGMAQKVQILGTLIHDPELVILDEPFSGLDPVNVELMRNIILDMKREGRTVIFSTHVMEQAEKLCDFIFLIDRGSKVIDGPLAEIKSRGDHGVQVDYDGDGAFMVDLSGVSRINDSGKSAEVFLKDGVDAQDFLKMIVDRVSVRRFDLREPSLHEIFVRAVGGKSDE